MRWPGTNPQEVARRGVEFGGRFASSSACPSNLSPCSVSNSTRRNASISLVRLSESKDSSPRWIAKPSIRKRTMSRRRSNQGQSISAFGVVSSLIARRTRLYSVRAGEQTTDNSLSVREATSSSVNARNTSVCMCSQA
jgi:hypothetical protein